MQKLLQTVILVQNTDSGVGINDFLTDSDNKYTIHRTHERRALQLLKNREPETMPPALTFGV